SYAEWVPDDMDEGKLKPIIDPETVIMQSSRERNSMLYGAVTLNDEAGEFHTYMEEFVPNTWFTRNPPQKFISLSSRPLPMPHDLKSWVVLKGVVTGGV
ncbi:MAG: major capsid protein, partial [Synergistaceae bacterium]|nr:major capsid protein [Synergistaceae bacterium]